MRVSSAQGLGYYPSCALVCASSDVFYLSARTRGVKSRMTDDGKLAGLGRTVAILPAEVAKRGRR
jgi:hypothetical protein